MDLHGHAHGDEHGHSHGAAPPGLAATEGHASHGHSHNFLADDHGTNELKTWLVIVLCVGSMAAEIACGIAFHSLALLADGIHMGTHDDSRFVFGTGKVGELAAYTSAILLIGVAFYILIEGILRFVHPGELRWLESLEVSFVGLGVNVLSGLILGLPCGAEAAGHAHGGHGHAHGGVAVKYDEEEEEELDEDNEAEVRRIATPDAGTLVLSIFEDGIPPAFRLAFMEPLSAPTAAAVADLRVTTVRPDGEKQVFAFQPLDTGAPHAGGAELVLQSTVEIPEPHTFHVQLHFGGAEYAVDFAESEHGHGHGHGHTSVPIPPGKRQKYERDNNYRAAVMHVAMDAVVSVLVVIALSVAGNVPHTRFLDPAVGIIGAIVILSWGWQLIADTSVALLDKNPDAALTQRMRARLERDGAVVADLHVWRLGPGTLGAVVSIVTQHPDRRSEFYRQQLSAFKAVKHLTVEVQQAGATSIAMSQVTCAVRVVLADLSDAKAAADWTLCTQAYACSETALGRPLPAETLRRSVVGLCSWPTARIFLAYVASPDGTGDEVAGVATCFIGWGTFAGAPLVNVHDLATLPQWRRRGVGKALLQAAVDCARREGCGKVTLEAYPHNAGAVALYHSFGFASQMHFFELKLVDV